jgi:hypothetical protein
MSPVTVRSILAVSVQANAVRRLVSARYAAVLVALFCASTISASEGRAASKACDSVNEGQPISQLVPSLFSQTSNGGPLQPQLQNGSWNIQSAMGIPAIKYGEFENGEQLEFIIQGINSPNDVTYLLSSSLVLAGKPEMIDNPVSQNPTYNAASRPSVILKNIHVVGKGRGLVMGSLTVLGFAQTFNNSVNVSYACCGAPVVNPDHKGVCMILP